MELKKFFFCLLLAFAFISLFSSSTSWMYKHVEYLDADIFSIIGKYWAQGYLPYIDLWDQKGPIIHFANAIGYGIAHSRLGVFGVQVLCLTITFYYTTKILQLELSSKSSYFLTILAALGLLNDYGCAGNNVEEYLLPLLTMAFYYMYKWLQNLQLGGKDHPPYYSVIYGMAFGVSIMTRMTNAMGLCGGVMIIFLIILHQKLWRNIVKNIFFFLIGTGCVLLPFIAYFYYHDGLYELWYGTIAYNIEYAQTAPELDPFSFNQTLYLYKSAINGLLLLFVSLFLLWFPQKRVNGILWLAVSGFSLLWLMTGNGFHHYFIITYPFLCISLNEVHKLYNDHLLQKSLYSHFVRVVSFVMLLGSGYEMYGAIGMMNHNNKNLAFYNEVKNDIPFQDMNSFVAYNVSPYIYLYLDIKPHCRFFAYQDPQISFSTSLKEKVISEFTRKKARYILMANNSKTLTDLLRKEYTLKKSYENGAKLYYHK